MPQSLPALSLREALTEVPAAALEAPLVLVGVEKSFGAQKVLKGIDLTVQRGSITTILGGSGTGKSVMLKHMIGLLRPDRGQVWVEGREWSTLSAAERKRARMSFGYLFQGAALFDSLTVGQNVAFPLREHTRLPPDQIEAKVRSLLEELGVEGAIHKYPSEISGGMRKRVALARAIVLDPAIVLYDEPTTGLDPLTKVQVNALIDLTRHAHNTTAVVVSHDLAATFTYSDHVVVLHEGEVVTQGSPVDVLTTPHPYLRRLCEAAGFAEPTALLQARVGA